MKKLMIAASLAVLASGCITVNKNDGGDDCLRPCIVKDKVHEKYEVGTTPVTATESLNVLFGLITWGKTATHVADAAPYKWLDTVGSVRNGAYANACDQAKCDSIVGTRYNVRVENYFVFKKLTCEITGYPAKITGVELIPVTQQCGGKNACGCSK